MSHITIEITECLTAYFYKPNGSSKPGTDWAVSMRENAKEYKVIVRSYKETLAGLNQKQQIEIVIQYIINLLNKGWHPKQFKGEPGELTLPIPADSNIG